MLDKPEFEARIRSYQESSGSSELDLSGIGIADTDARFVAERLKSLTGLKDLALLRNALGPEGILGILTRLSEGLDALNLSFNRIGAVGAKHIANYLPQLRRLYVADNNLGREGAVYLSRMHELRQLNIASNAIADLGLQHLSKSLPHLTGIGLEFNELTDGPALIEFLASRQPEHASGQRCGTLIYINVSGNPLAWPDLPRKMPASTLSITEPSTLLKQLEKQIRRVTTSNSASPSRIMPNTQAATLALPEWCQGLTLSVQERMILDTIWYYVHRAAGEESLNKGQLVYRLASDYAGGQPKISEVRTLSNHIQRLCKNKWITVITLPGKKGKFYTLSQDAIDFRNELRRLKKLPASTRE